MARHPRFQAPDYIRHVMARGNGRQAIFLDDHDRRHFIYLLEDALQQFAVECWNYCLMPNHYHLTILPRRPNFSAAIRRINGSYGLWWNRRHGQVGHVFQGRFKDQLVDRDSYLLNLTRYVAMNPVRAGLVACPEDWAWSSHRATIGATEAPPFLSVESTLSLFGTSDPETLRSRYAEFVGVTPDAAVVDRIRSNARVLGSHAFAQSFRTDKAA